MQKRSVARLEEEQRNGEENPNRGGEVARCGDRHRKRASECKTDRRDSIPQHDVCQP